ncbi:hypothetical protein [Acidocella sp.]|uniref:hypothetical protein n=1 Tax=Acidocella sp. TaxID=50710 RepID=UPI0026050A92|nr:hypothetical protein [Acidocella sp.]
MLKRHLSAMWLSATAVILLCAGTAIAQPSSGWGPGFGIGPGMMGWAMGSSAIPHSG